MTVISDTEWTAKTTSSNEKTNVTTHYTSTFDEAKKQVIIEDVSDTKREHDYIYLTVTEVSASEVTLTIEVEINTGVHLLAKAVGAFFSKPMEKIMTKHIYQNFEALCTGNETKIMSKEELDAHAKDALS